NLTDRITYLEEGDRAEVTRAGAVIFDAQGREVSRPEKRIAQAAAQVDKAGHKHFMAKEIAEQPRVLAEALGHYLTPEGQIALPAPGIDFTAIERLTLVACGTAFYACNVAKYWFEQVARLPVEIDVASEYRYREPPV
ncbi:glutamine--fructose-6-phosphate aminotransferase, partial [Limimaricola sp. G21655-S1]|nr:glutamine--fructose-6-phosphate aminotransferase [Limimaricola sp. G21655-S1]